MSDRECIDRIEEWIRRLGPAPKRQSPTALKVVLKIPNIGHCTVYFSAEDGYVYFTSYVFESVVGDLRHLVVFKDSLLAANDRIGPLGFGLKPIEQADSREKWIITLKGGQRCDTMTPHALRELLLVYKFVYAQTVPRLEQLASELGLECTGECNQTLRRIIRWIIEGEGD